jgi:AraC family transcriptional regulator
VSAFRNFMVLTESINIIEENLRERITREEIAARCFVSLSALEKLYRYALHMSIKDYTERRRMTIAAKDLAEGGYSVTETAMRCGYNSPEVFSRAFKRVWNVNPSEFCNRWKFTGIFPKINYEYREGEDLYMARKKLDISEAYDYLRDHAGSVVYCFDIMGLMEVNNVSRKAGDLIILEALQRIDRAAGDDMLTLRIGGDEFALVTGLKSEEEAQTYADRILADNGKPVTCDGRDFPVSLWCGVTRIPEKLRYGEFFTDLHRAIVESKK